MKTRNITSMKTAGVQRLVNKPLSKEELVQKSLPAKTRYIMVKIVPTNLVQFFFF